MNIKSKFFIKLKILNSYFIALAALLALAAISCSYNVQTSQIKTGPNSTADNFIIWAHSDIQPRNRKERIFYERAINDINSNFPAANLALVAGDIVHWSDSDEDFKWFLDTKKKSSIKYWYEIAGNHDHKNKENYSRYIQLPLHYSVSIGNMIIICLSDETKSAETNISDDAFNFWKDIVINNQNKIIVTMTHGYLKQSGLFGSIIESRNIKNSERFADVLKKYRVDIWICGHTHLPHFLNGSVKIADALNGTLFINVSAIRGGTLKDGESFLFFFKKDSDDLIVRSRNHAEKKFNMDDIKNKLSHKFHWDNSPPVINKMEHKEKLIVGSVK